MKQPITKEKIEKLQRQNVVVRLIDIRTAEEYEKMHIPYAENIPAEIVTQSTGSFAPAETIVCICNKGHDRSQNAAEQVALAGFAHVYYLEGGILGWFAE